MPRSSSSGSPRPTRCSPTRSAGSATTCSVRRPVVSATSASVTFSRPSSAATSAAGSRAARCAARTCVRCAGSGAEPGTSTSTCATCNGRGEVRQVQQSVFGRFVNVSTCPRCGGAGKTVDKVCTKCRGEGRERRDRELTLTIPAGIDDGQQLRVPGAGEAGLRSGPTGDLYVLVRFSEHPLFRREGDDLVHVLRLSPAQAALGDEVSVPTIDGADAKVRIPAGAQHGQVVRVRGKGVPHYGSASRGDQLLYLDVVVPRNLTKDQRRLYGQLRDMEGPTSQDGDGQDLFGR